MGAVTAARLVERGIRSLEQLREAVAKGQETLDAAQQLGLRHAEAFQQRIGWEEMQRHEKSLQEMREELVLQVGSRDVI